MADIINPYANPYLPSFVNQRPRVNDGRSTMQNPTLGMPNFTTIHSVKGFDGARNYNLSPGSSEILAEEDPNIPRIYVVACDPSGQKFVEAFRLEKEEEPKQITMDDLNMKMSELLDRMNKLEEDKKNHVESESNNQYYGKDAESTSYEQSRPNSWSRKNVHEPSGNSSTNARK